MSNFWETEKDLTDAEQELVIAHKDFDVWGGGEYLASVLAEGLDAPLVVGHGDTDRAPDDLNVTELEPDSRWHRLADRGGLPRAIAHMMLWRDHAPKELDDADVVVTSGNEPQWWTPPEDTAWVAYTHSTPRWLYDLYNDLDGWVTRTANQVKRWVYQQDMDGPDLWVANSEIVARRMRRYWGVPDRDIRVVYPPVDTGGLSPDAADTGDYYLSLGRLAEVKNLREVVEAATEQDLPLVVAGEGPLRDELEAMAGPTVEFAGWVEDGEKERLLAGAKALINNSRNEDFGIVPIEAIASGTPVLTVNEGMPQYTVLEPEVGRTYKRGELASAIESLEDDGVSWTANEMARWAHETFSRERFVSEMEQAVADARERAMVQPQLRPTRQPAVADGGESDA